MLREFAPAKINLFLHVLGRRPDGYHLLDSIAAFAAAGDWLEAAPAAELVLEVAGPFGPALAADPDNLVLRAARGLAAACGRPAGAAIRLDKQLPVASGIGGGSADAAATLRLLSALWDIQLPAGRLHALAAGLGADVPVCLAGRAARLRGTGTELDAAPGLPPCGVALVNPGVALSTAAVFAARAQPYSAPATLPACWRDARAMAADLARLSNDLEPVAGALCPLIGEVLAALRGLPSCLLARMSGSGATCFGLFARSEDAAAAAAALARPGWWSWGGALRG